MSDKESQDLKHDNAPDEPQVLKVRFSFVRKHGFYIIAKTSEVVTPGKNTKKAKGKEKEQTQSNKKKRCETKENDVDSSDDQYEPKEREEGGDGSCESTDDENVAEHQKTSRRPSLNNELGAFNLGQHNSIIDESSNSSFSSDCSGTVFFRDDTQGSERDDVEFDIDRSSLVEGEPAAADVASNGDRAPDWYQGGDMVALKMCQGDFQMSILPCPFLVYTVWAIERPLEGLIEFTTRSKLIKSSGNDISKKKLPVFEVLFIESCKKVASFIDKSLIVNHMLEHSSFDRKLIRKNLRDTKNYVRTWADIVVTSHAGMKNHLKREIVPFFESAEYHELACHFSPHGVYYLPDDMRAELIRLVRNDPHVFCLPPIRDDILTAWYLGYGHDEAGTLGGSQEVGTKKRGAPGKPTSPGKSANQGTPQEPVKRRSTYGRSKKDLTTRYIWNPVFRRMTDGKSTDWLRCVTIHNGAPGGMKIWQDVSSFHTDYANCEFKSVTYGKYLFSVGPTGIPWPETADAMKEIELMNDISTYKWAQGGSRDTLSYSHMDKIEFGISTMLTTLCSVDGGATYRVEMYNVEEPRGRGRILKDTVLSGSIKGVLFMSATLDTCLDLKDSGLGTSINVYSVQASPFGIYSLLQDKGVTTLVIDSFHWVSDYSFYVLCKMINDALEAGSSLRKLVLLGNSYSPYGTGMVSKGVSMTEMWNSYTFYNDVVTFPKGMEDKLAFLRLKPESVSVKHAHGTLYVGIICGSILEHPSSTQGGENSKRGSWSKTAEGGISGSLRKALFDFWRDNRNARISTQVTCSNMRLCGMVNKTLYYCRTSASVTEAKKREMESGEWRWDQFRCRDKVVLEDMSQLGIITALQVGNMTVSDETVRASASARTYVALDCQQRDMGHISCCGLRANSANLAVHTVRHAECLTQLNMRRSCIKKGLFLVTKETTKAEIEYFLGICTEEATLYADSITSISDAMSKTSINNKSDLGDKLKYLFARD